jgi:hypothetical protein
MDGPLERSTTSRHLPDAPRESQGAFLCPSIISSLFLFTSSLEEVAQPDKSGGSVHVHA